MEDSAVLFWGQGRDGKGREKEKAVELSWGQSGQVEQIAKNLQSPGQDSDLIPGEREGLQSWLTHDCGGRGHQE